MKQITLKLNESEIDAILGYIQLFADDPCDEEQEKECKALARKIRRQLTANH